MSVIEKIDAEIAELTKFKKGQTKKDKLRLDAIISGLKKAKKFILFEQIDGNGNVVEELKEPLTIGDKIRENNESLANEIMKFGQRCYDCDYKEKPECNVKSCKDGILEYLSQPYTEVYDD